MKKLNFGLNYFVLLFLFLLSSCSKDSDSVSNENLSNYSVVGEWKTTSAVLNGVQKLGGTNPLKSERTFFDADGTLFTASCSNPTFNEIDVFAISSGTWSVIGTSTLNQNADAYYYPSLDIIGSYNINCEVLKINATQLEIRINNFPNPNDIYIKKFTKI
jgi:hypothetical protein